jgi:hypothetical protein
MADADPAIVANAVSKVYGFVKEGKEVDPASQPTTPRLAHTALLLWIKPLAMSNRE